MSEPPPPAENDGATVVADMPPPPPPAADKAANAEPTNKDLMAGMKKFLHDTKVQGKSVFAMTKETLFMADGKNKRTDKTASTEMEALVLLKDMVTEAKSCEKVEEMAKWDLPYTPLKELNASVADVLTAFVKWALVEDNDNDASNDNPKPSSQPQPTSSSPSSQSSDFSIDEEETTATAESAEDDEQLPPAATAGERVYNVSKAFRRFETYVKWMADHKDKLSEPLSPQAMAPAAKTFGFKMTHAKDGRLVWWFDVAAMNLDAFKNKQISVLEAVRFSVYLIHICMLDPQAQDYGMTFVEDLMHVGAWKFMTAFPMEVNVQLDRLTIGCMPVKMKSIYVMNAAAWMKVMINIMKPFMGKKMRRRMVIIKKQEDPKQIISEAVGGLDHVPVNCCGLGGTLENDLIFGKYITTKTEE